MRCAMVGALLLCASLMRATRVRKILRMQQSPDEINQAKQITSRLSLGPRNTARRLKTGIQMRSHSHMQSRSSIDSKQMFGEAAVVQTVRDSVPGVGMAEDAFFNVTNAMLDRVIFGFPMDMDKGPRILRSIMSLRNLNLREFKGDQVRASKQVTRKFRGLPTELQTLFTAGAMHLLESIIPPLAIINFGWKLYRKLWMTLRKTALIAAINGYNMTAQETRNKIMLVAWVGLPPIIIAGQSVRMFGKLLFRSLVSVALPGLPIAAVITLPVDFVIKRLLNVDGRALKFACGKTFPHHADIPKVEYEKLLDPEPEWSKIDSHLGNIIKGAPVERR